MLDKEYQSQLLIRLNRMKLHSSRLKVIKQAAVRGSTAGLLLLSILIVSSCTTSVSSSASSDIASTESGAILAPKSTFTPEVLPSSKTNGTNQLAVIFDKEWIYINNGGKIDLGDGLLMELFVDPYPPTRLRAFLDVYLTRDDVPVTEAEVEIGYDMLGMFQDFTPKFVKKYTNLSEIIEKVLGDYIDEIRTEKFPQEKHCYKMREGELEKLKALL